MPALPACQMTPVRFQGDGTLHSLPVQGAIARGGHKE